MFVAALMYYAANITEDASRIAADGTAAGVETFQGYACENQATWVVGAIPEVTHWETQPWG